MEIREIDGRKYIEFNEDKHRKKRLLISIIFLILLTVAIIALISVTVTLVKNKEVIQKDPLRYGMDVHGFVSCQCTDQEGKDWYSKDTGFINNERGVGWINYSEPKYHDFNFTDIFEVDGNGTG
jgi:aspartate carbamoyltransferase regulatory subunit